MGQDDEKRKHLQQKLEYYQAKLTEKLKHYRGVIHESAASELKHSEVMVLQSLVDSLQKEIKQLDASPKTLTPAPTTSGEKP